MHAYKYLALIAALYISGMSALSVPSARDVEQPLCHTQGEGCNRDQDCCNYPVPLHCYTPTGVSGVRSGSDVIKSNPTTFVDMH